MPSCVLRYCNNNTKNTAKCNGITFHRFPRPMHESREKWIKFVQKNRSEETWLPSDHSNICSKHFREEDKYLTKTGRVMLKKSAVPCDNPEMSHDDGTIDPISDSVSDSDSIFDTPQKIVLKQKINKLTLDKKKLVCKIKKVQRQNRILQKKCETMTNLFKFNKTKSSFENNLQGSEELGGIQRRIVKNVNQCYQKCKPSLPWISQWRNDIVTSDVFRTCR